MTLVVARFIFTDCVCPLYVAETVHTIVCEGEKMSVILCPQVLQASCI